MTSYTIMDVRRTANEMFYDLVHRTNQELKYNLTKRFNKEEFLKAVEEIRQWENDIINILKEGSVE